MVDASVPFNTVNSAYYQPMIDAIANIGAGYKGPKFGRVRGYLLSKLVEDVKKIIKRYREIWKQTGCTIMADRWTDRCRHSLINFLVYCPKGTIFLKSVDASHASKTAELLFRLFKDVVNFVGPENVVHIVTDNAANYVAAGSCYYELFLILICHKCTNVDQLNLEDDQDNDGPSNSAMEDMDANQNEGNVDQAPHLSYEDVDADF
ncbi:hypothetical protein AHAS_Ahas13G0322300 [Arachis hypogaea]